MARRERNKKKKNTATNERGKRAGLEGRAEKSAKTQYKREGLAVCRERKRKCGIDGYKNKTEKIMSVEKRTGERMGVGTAKQCSVKTRRRWKRTCDSHILLLKGGCEIRRRNGEREEDGS